MGAWLEAAVNCINGSHIYADIKELRGGEGEREEKSVGSLELPKMRQGGLSGQLTVSDKSVTRV